MYIALWSAVMYWWKGNIPAFCIVSASFFVPNMKSICCEPVMWLLIFENLYLYPIKSIIFVSARKLPTSSLPSGELMSVIRIISPSYVWYFCMSSPWNLVCLMCGVFVCLVSSFRYNGLATLALAAFGRVRALRARCGPFGPAGETAFGLPAYQDSA